MTQETIEAFELPVADLIELLSAPYVTVVPDDQVVAVLIEMLDSNERDDYVV